MALDQNWLTVNPIFENNIPIATSVRKLHQEKLINLFTSLHKSTKNDCSKLIDIIKSLDISKAWSPLLFMTYYELRAVMLTRNLPLINEKFASVQIVFKQFENLYCNSILIESVGSNCWEKDYIEKLRKYDQKNIRGESTEVWPVSEDELPFHKKNIESALELIKCHDPEQYAEIETFVSYIKIFQGKVLRGDTSPMSFGSMWLRIPDPNDDQVGYWIEHIIHELAHLRLESIFFHEELVLNPYTEKIFVAPIRDDLRPMRGIFHATFVLIRMKRMFTKLSFAGMDIRFRDRLRLCELQLKIGMQSVFSELAIFSEAGAMIRESFLNENT